MLFHWHFINISEKCFKKCDLGKSRSFTFGFKIVYTFLIKQKKKRKKTSCAKSYSLV